MRVNDLSKELGIANKELLVILNEKGIDAKSHMSSITDEQAEMVRSAFAKKAAVKAESPKPAEKKAEAPKEAPAPKEEEPKSEAPKAAEKKAGRSYRVSGNHIFEK